jgi:hypothetical protein
MATSFDNLWGGGTPSGGSIPPVEPADLRSVWTMQSEIQARNPGQQIGISADAYKQACGPEADVRAVFERVSHLGLWQIGGMLTPWLHDDVLDDAVFHVAANIRCAECKEESCITNRRLTLKNLLNKSRSEFRVNPVAETDRLPDNCFALTPAILERTP